MSALCIKLRVGNDRARDQDLTGVSTYSFTFWKGHPLESEMGANAPAQIW